MWPMTLNELEGHSSVSGLFKMHVMYIGAGIYKISTGTHASCSPSATAGLLVLYYDHHINKACRELFDSLMQ